MALADLMKKGFLTSATATPATLATHGRGNPSTVATVATVAVANDWKSKLFNPTVATVAVAKLPKVKNAHLPAKQKLPLADTLALFRFDLVQQEIADGHPADELNRVNNMAFELMQADGMAFDEAIKLAGEIVAHGRIAACEAAYVDVMALFKRLGGSG